MIADASYSQTSSRQKVRSRKAILERAPQDRKTYEWSFTYNRLNLREIHHRVKQLEARLDMFEDTKMHHRVRESGVVLSMSAFC